jgi:hypothetical protein
MSDAVHQIEKGRHANIAARTQIRLLCAIASRATTPRKDAVALNRRVQNTELQRNEQIQPKHPRVQLSNAASER